MIAVISVHTPNKDNIPHTSDTVALELLSLGLYTGGGVVARPAPLYPLFWLYAPL